MSMSSLSSERRIDKFDRLLEALPSSTSALRVSTAPDSGAPLAQPSSVVGASSSHGAPPLRPSVPHDVSTVSSVPHDGSVTSMVGSVGGGVRGLARVSALGRSQNKLKLHVLPSFDMLHMDVWPYTGLDVALCSMRRSVKRARLGGIIG